MTTALATRNNAPAAIRPESWAGAAARGLEARHEREAIVRNVLIEGVDTKPIPGCGDKPVLHDCGAQKILDSLNLWPDYEIVKEVEDWQGRFWFYRYRCVARQRGSDIAVTTGIGSCNSRESKYGYRWVPRHLVPESAGPAEKLPSKGGRASEFSFAIEKAETSGQYGKPAEYWKRYTDAIANRTAKPIKRATRNGKQMDAWEIDDTLYRVINDDVETQVNTVDKMAQKRARVAACIALGFGEWLTQDIEDNPESFGGHVPSYADDKPAPPVAEPAKVKGTNGASGTITLEQAKVLHEAMKLTGLTDVKERFFAHFGIKKFGELHLAQLAEAGDYVASLGVPVSAATSPPPEMVPVVEHDPEPIPEFSDDDTAIAAFDADFTDAYNAAGTTQELERIVGSMLKNQQVWLQTMGKYDLYHQAFQERFKALSAKKKGATA